MFMRYPPAPVSPWLVVLKQMCSIFLKEEVGERRTHDGQGIASNSMEQAKGSEPDRKGAGVAGPVDLLSLCVGHGLGVWRTVCELGGMEEKEWGHCSRNLTLP